MTESTITLAAHPQATAWVRIHENGDLELELYDRDYQGTERADLYRVACADLVRLAGHMMARVGRPVRQEELLAAIQATFSSWYDLIAWLRETGVPITHHVDTMP